MLISVVVTSYNYQKYLKDTINSIISQTYKDWEMIVVDDASTDLSVEIIREFAKNDKRIKMIENKVNLGLKKSLQKGIEAASGEWIAFIESDDMWREDYLEKKVAIIHEYPETGLIFNDVELFGDEDVISSKKKNFYQSATVLNRRKYPCILFNDLTLFNRLLTFSAVIVKKEILTKCSFDTPVDKCLDWWLFLHLAKHNLFFYIPEKLTKWRLHNESYINKREALFDIPVNLAALTDILKKEKDLSVIPHIILTVFNSLPRLKTRLIQLIKIRLKLPLKNQ